MPRSCRQANNLAPYTVHLAQCAAHAKVSALLPAATGATQTANYFHPPNSYRHILLLPFNLVVRAICLFPRHKTKLCRTTDEQQHRGARRRRWPSKVDSSRTRKVCYPCSMLAVRTPVLRTEVEICVPRNACKNPQTETHLL